METMLAGVPEYADHWGSSTEPPGTTPVLSCDDTCSSG